jgi:AcrR family transcriptional regulator
MNQLKLKRDPEGTRRRILEAATEEFASGGLSGARVDQIARRALTNERMLYYYFGSKEQLFIAVLEQTYASFVEAERSLDLDGMEPVEAIRTLARFIWTYFREQENWLRLINNENLHEARYLKRSARIRETMSPALEVLRTTLERGVQAGVFREGIDPLDFYVTLCALGYYVLSNRYTLETFTGRDYGGETEHESIVRLHLDIVLGYVVRPGRATAATGQD